MSRKIILLIFFCVSVSLCESQEIVSVYKDTLLEKAFQFTVDNVKFRFRLVRDTDYVVAIEKFNVNWSMVDSSEIFEKIMFKDLNADGFIDFGFYEKWSVEVWLYNPIKKTFTASGDYPIMEFRDDEKHMVLLDNSKNIYYDYSWYKRGEWTSTLFMIKDYKRIELAFISNVSHYNEKQRDYVTEFIEINKFNEDGDFKLIKRIRWNDKKVFKYADYWKKNWENYYK